MKDALQLFALLFTFLGVAMNVTIIFISRLLTEDIPMNEILKDSYFNFKGMLSWLIWTFNSISIASVIYLLMTN